MIQFMNKIVLITIPKGTLNVTVIYVNASVSPLST